MLYNPTTMSFITADPSGFKGGMNWYLYANGNTLAFIDRLGLSIEDPNTAQALIMIGYTETPLGNWNSVTPYHTFVIAENMKTGEKFASRAGPNATISTIAMSMSLPSKIYTEITGKATFGGYGFGSLYAQNAEYNHKFIDNPSNTIVSQVIGISHVNYGKTVQYINDYAKSVNSSNYAYHPTKMNCNSYSFSLSENLTGHNSRPIINAPGYSTRLPNSPMMNYWSASDIYNTGKIYK